MTNQRESFCNWYKDLFGVEPWLQGCDMKKCDAMELAWQAVQADQAEYIAMLELNNKFKDDRIEQLQLDNEKLREALEACKYDCHTGEVIGIAKEALGETK